MEDKKVGSKEWFETSLSEDKGIYLEEAELDFFKSPENAKDVHECYSSVTASADRAYIYRRSEPDKQATLYKDHMKLLYKEIWYKCFTKIKANAQEPVESILSEISSSSNVLDRLFVFIFNDDFVKSGKEFVLEAQKIIRIAKGNLDDEKACLDAWYDNEVEEFMENNGETLENTAFHFAKEEYFGMEHAFSLEDISRAQAELQDGRVYQLPASGHTWLNNLSWLLAHIHKGHPFLLFSEIVPNAMTRVSQKHAGELSGFAREIALLTKLGYQFELSGSKIKLSPPEDKSLIENLSIQDALMTNNDVPLFYNQAIEKAKTIKVMLQEVESKELPTVGKETENMSTLYGSVFKTDENRKRKDRDEPAQTEQETKESDNKKPNVGLGPSAGSTGDN